MEKLREEHGVGGGGRCASLAAVHRDLPLVVAVASIAQEVFRLWPDADLRRRWWRCGVRGSWATHDLHLQVATGLLAAAALQKLTQLLHVEVGLPEQDVLWLHRDWRGLCLLAHKRTGKRMMTLQTNHSRR